MFTTFDETARFFGFDVKKPRLANHVFRCIRCGKRYGSASPLKDSLTQWCIHCGGELEEVKDGN